MLRNNSHEDEVIAALMEFDIDETDALLYLSLLKMGSTTVNSLSSKLDLDKAKVYRALHRLQNLGLVTTTFSNPTICQAIDPDDTLSTIIYKKNEQIARMHKMLKKISNVADKYKNSSTERPTQSTFYIIQGRSSIYARIGKMIQDSTSDIYIVTPLSDVMRMNYTAIPEKINLYQNNSRHVYLVTENDDDMKNAEYDIGVSKTTKIQLPSRGRIIVSENLLIMSGNVNDTMNMTDESDSAVYTNSRGIIDNIFRYCQYLQNYPVRALQQGYQ